MEGSDGRRRLSRRDFLKGAVVGGGAALAAATLGEKALRSDPERPPELYEYFVDSYWFQSSGLLEQPLRPPLRGAQKADLAIVGGGFAGLASAYQLARRFPTRRIVLLEGARCGYGASGRNGGFADVTYTGLGDYCDARGPEAARLVYDAIAGGMAEIENLVRVHGVDCDLEATGSLQLAMSQRQAAALEEEMFARRAMGLEARMVEGAELQGLVRSPRFVAGLLAPDTSILDPGKLALGMKRVVESLGVEIFETSRVLGIEPGRSLRIRTEFGSLEAPQAVLAVNGYAPQLGYFRTGILPLCNYVVATEPLTPAQREAIGWAGRQGLSDARAEFMYLRLTADDRIVFGGEMAPYFFDSRLSSGNYAPAIERLQRSILQTFPQLEGIRFSNAWGGTMGFTRDFTPRVGVLGEHGNLFYALAFCGEGVVMTQLAGRLVSTLVAGEGAALEGLPFVGSAFPYLGFEPARYAGVKVMERAMRLLAGD